MTKSIEQFNTSKAIELAENLGVNIEQFTPSEIERASDISKAVNEIDANIEKHNDPRERFGAFLTTLAVAEAYPQLLKEEVLGEDEAVQADDVDLLTSIHHLGELGVTDLEPFVTELDPTKFDETDDPTAILTSLLNKVTESAKEYKESVSADEHRPYVRGYDEDTEEIEGFEDDDDLEDDDETAVDTIIVNGSETEF